MNILLKEIIQNAMINVPQKEIELMSKTKLKVLKWFKLFKYFIAIN